MGLGGSIKRKIKNSGLSAGCGNCISPLLTDNPHYDLKIIIFTMGYTLHGQVILMCLKDD